MIVAVLAALLLQLALTRAPRGRRVPFVLTTANIAGDLDRDRAARAYEIALLGTHMLGTQEMQQRDAASFVDRREWGTLQGRVGTARARCALHYRLGRFKLLRWRVSLLHLSRLFPSANRWMIFGTFRDRRTGRLITVVVIHFGPHYDDARGGISDAPRGRLATLSITMLLRLAAHVHGNLFVTGDFNIDARKDMTHHDPTDLIERLSRAGLHSVSVELDCALPTHGRSSYDQTFWRTHREHDEPVVELDEQETLHDGPGDHLAFRSHFTIEAA